MLRLLKIFFFSLFIINANASNNEKIIENLNDTENFIFEFEQNINGKIDTGNCIIEYPKKIYCSYNKKYKIIVSNGKSLVIKTASSYYRYPLYKTPLNLILDKNFLINKIYNLKEKIIDESYINYTITDKENKIDVFFDIDTLELIGWQIKDIYQNTSLTLLYSIKKNQSVEKKWFKLPPQS
tara:strand:+ start:36 stop:581 length:546 start_codon:yes stop_codon:yes gene_type:complete